MLPAQVTFYLHHFLTTRLPPHAGASAGGGNTSSGGDGAGGAAPSMQQLVDYISSQRLSSELQVRTDLYPRALADVPVTHFFGAAAPAAQGGGSGDAAGSGSGTPEPAVGALLAAAQQGNSHAPETAHAAAGQPAQRAPLFALLEAAGGGACGGGSAQAAVAVVVGWAAVAALAARILHF